ncbi:anticodon-binding domain-containing protein [Gongronella butleri]|nr:anticodon-binding domain-containing protein [Gongronella butleri]
MEASNQRRKSVTKQQQQQAPATSSFASIVGAPSTPADTKKSTEWMIGRRIKVKTTLDEEIEGLIYTVDRATNCIALDCSAGSRHTRKSLAFRIIKMPHIKEIVSVTSDEAAAPLQDPAIAHTSKLTSYLPVNPVHMDRIVAREQEAVRSIRQQAAKIGVGVTKDAQDIFDALTKTLPCRWANDTIVVMDEVIITPPYDVANCKANTSAAASLARVKKVLEGERRRLKIGSSQ